MSTVNLAPLSLGELLDRIFSTFRKHFWLFAGIMVPPQGVMVALNILVQVYMSRMVTMAATNPQSPQAAAQATAAGMRAGLLAIGALIPHYIIYAMALGAATYALSEVYLGRTTTIRQSYRVVKRKVGQLLNVIISVLLRCVGFVVLFSLGSMLVIIAITIVAPLAKSMAWLGALMAIVAFLGFLSGAVLMVVFLVRYSVAVPALILENLSARQAIKRSVVLTKGYLWRLLVVGGLMSLITFTLVSLCQAPFMLASLPMVFKGGQPGLWLTIPTVLVGGVAAVATSPLLMIGFAIAYYDLRVRKEGFDLQLMMSNLDATTAPGAIGQTPLKEEVRLLDASVLGIIFASIITAGIYLPIWFMTRRKALNNLRSPEKLGIVGLSVALLAFVASFALPIVGSFKWGSWIEAENALGPAHPLILLIAAIIMVVQCFKVRRMLLDHLAPPEEGMFAASIRFQNDELLSRTGTFFLSIFYLQHKINGLIDRLTADEGSQGAAVMAAVPESPIPSINS